MTDGLTITIPANSVNTVSGYPNKLPAGAAGKFLTWVFKTLGNAAVADKVEEKIQVLLSGPIQEILENKNQGGVLIEVPIYDYPIPFSQVFLVGQGIYNMGWGKTPVDAGARYLRYQHMKVTPPDHAKLSDTSHFIWIKGSEDSFDISQVNHLVLWKESLKERRRRDLELALLKKSWEEDPDKTAARSLELLEHELEHSTIQKSKFDALRGHALRAAKLKTDFMRAAKTMQEASSNAKRAAGTKAFMSILNGLQIGVNLYTSSGQEITDEKIDSQYGISVQTFKESGKYLRETIIKSEHSIQTFILEANEDTGVVRFIEDIYQINEMEGIQTIP